MPPRRLLPPPSRRPGAPGPYAPNRARRRARVSLYAASAVQDISWGLALYAMPVFATKKLGATFWDLGLLVLVPTLVYTVCTPLFGRLSDRLGRWPLGVSGGMVLAAAALLIPSASSVSVLMAILCLGWLGLAAFWPVLEAGLADAAPRGKLFGVMGTFNVTWASGMFLGGIFAGMITSALGVEHCFTAIAAVSLTAAALQWLAGAYSRMARDASKESGAAASDESTAPEEPREAESPEPPESTESSSGAGATVSRRGRELFRYAALVTNMAAVGGNASLRQFLPKLGDFGPITMSFLHSCMTGAIIVTFAVLTCWRGWHYRAASLVAALVLLGGGGGLMILGGGRPVYAIAFALVGAALGIGYTSSIFYSVADSHEATGRRTGVHESFLSIGVAIIPFTGGFIAESAGWGGAPYVVVAATGAAALLVVLALTRRARRRGGGET